MLDTLPPPPVRDHPQNDMWVDEQIWGHRLWDSTTPWLIFLEFNPNHVLFSCARVACFVRDRFSPPNVPKLDLTSADLSIRSGRIVRIIAKCDGNATSVAVLRLEYARRHADVEHPHEFVIDEQLLGNAFSTLRLTEDN